MKLNIHKKQQQQQQQRCLTSSPLWVHLNSDHLLQPTTQTIILTNMFNHLIPLSWLIYQTTNSRCFFLFFLENRFLPFLQSSFNVIILTFTTFWTNSADDKLITFFFLFSPENRFLRLMQIVCFEKNCLLRRQCAWNDFMQIEAICMSC